MSNYQLLWNLSCLSQPLKKYWNRGCYPLTLVTTSSPSSSPQHCNWCKGTACSPLLQAGGKHRASSHSTRHTTEGTPQRCWELCSCDGHWEIKPLYLLIVIITGCWQKWASLGLAASSALYTNIPIPRLTCLRGDRMRQMGWEPLKRALTR